MEFANDEPFWKASMRFWWKVGKALQLVVALILFAYVDKLVMIVLSITVFEHSPNDAFNRLLEVIGRGAFAFLYVYLLWDMLVVFMPFLRAKPVAIASTSGTRHLSLTLRESSNTLDGEKFGNG
jgi:hypothetical protein